MAWRDILDMIFSVIKTAEPVDILDILVLSYVVYVVMKLVRETRAGQLVKGIMLLFLVYIVASWIKMKAISYLMSETLNIGICFSRSCAVPWKRRGTPSWDFASA